MDGLSFRRGFIIRQRNVSGFASSQRKRPVMLIMELVMRHLFRFSGPKFGMDWLKVNDKWRQHLSTSLTLI